MCLTAVKNDGMALEFVKNQTNEICIEAVKQHGWALQHVKEQNPEVCIKAVEQDGWALRYVNNQSKEICLAAVKSDGTALKYVAEQTPEICLAAIKQNGSAVKYAKHSMLDLNNHITLENESGINLYANKIDGEWIFSLGVVNNITKNEFIDVINKAKDSSCNSQHIQVYVDFLNKF